MSARAGVLAGCVAGVLLTPTLARADEPAEAPHVAIDGAPDHRVHVRLDTSATWGIGGQMNLGVDVHATGYVPVWTTKKATGTVDFGVDAIYENGPTFLAPWIDTSEVTGATHRVTALATFGTAFHFGRERRASFGVHAFAGMTHWISDYTVNYAEEGFSDSATVTDNLFVAGAKVTFAYRFSKVVGVNVIALAPLPTASAYAITFGHVGAGLTFYVR